MREIKFRAWDKKEKKMLNVMQLKFKFDVEKYNQFATALLDGRWAIAEVDPVFPNEKHGYSWNSQERSAETVELMQYTGLKDKNGKEIYEGDIVKYTDEILMEIRWGKNMFWETRDIKHPTIQGIGTLNRYKNNDLEIIGNIYENPNLLEQ